MAAAGGEKTVKVTINEVEVEVPQGELIVESVKRLGLDIPVFCYHPRMKPVGMCRMCLVDVGFKQPDGSVRMMPKPQAGCTLPASEGMVVYTDTENVHRDRRGVLEFLLINHPLDCPICDRGGECPLQNNTLAYGPSTSRFLELKRHLPKAFPLSRYVTLDLERCIQCGRCVRFTEEISGESELAFRFRGASMQPSTFQLMDFESKFSGNVIEICPVGALTSAKYRFRARPWDLETSPAVCTKCSNGCNVWLDYRAGRFVRINGRANESVNEEWTCDKGKFGHDDLNSPKRLTKPLLRDGDSFVETTWADAYEAISRGFSRPGHEVAGLTGPTVTNEGLFLFQKMMREAFGSESVDHRWTDQTAPYSAKTAIAGLEGKASVLVFACDLADELPIVYLRLRKAATQTGTKVVVAWPSETEVDEFATAAIRYRPGSEAALAKAVASGSEGTAQAEAGVDPDEFKKALAALGQGTVVVASDRLLDKPGGLQAWDSIRAFAEAKGGEANLFATGANAMGASSLNVVPGPGGLGTDAVLAACDNGSVKALWLVECDPTGRAGGREALEGAEFVVYQGTLENEAVAYANVVLPMAAPAEQDGTWTNCEGRLQRMVQAIPPIGESKPSWRIFAETLLRMRPSTPYFNPREVMEAMAQDAAAFAGVAYDEIPEEGVVLSGDKTPALAGEGA